MLDFGLSRWLRGGATRRAAGRSGRVIRPATIKRIGGRRAAAIARVADAAVVGSALVNRIAEGIGAAGEPEASLVASVLDYAKALAEGVRNARLETHTATGAGRKLSFGEGS